MGIFRFLGSTCTFTISKPNGSRTSFAMLSFAHATTSGCNLPLFLRLTVPLLFWAQAICSSKLWWLLQASAVASAALRHLLTEYNAFQTMSKHQRWGHCPRYDQPDPLLSRLTLSARLSPCALQDGPIMESRSSYSRQSDCVGLTSSISPSALTWPPCCSHLSMDIYLRQPSVVFLFHC